MYHRSTFMSGTLMNGGNKAHYAARMRTALDIRLADAMTHPSHGRQLRVAIKSGLSPSPSSGGGWLFHALREAMKPPIYVTLGSDRELWIRVNWVAGERPVEQIQDIRNCVAATIGLVDAKRLTRGLDADFCFASDYRASAWTPTAHTTIKTAPVPTGAPYKAWAKRFPTEIGAWNPEYEARAQRVIDNHDIVRVSVDCTGNGFTMHEAELIDGSLAHGNR